jgi:hypothetical protein
VPVSKHKKQNEKTGVGSKLQGCNPSYSGGKDQEDHGLKTAWMNISTDPILKIPNMEKDWCSGSSGRVPA